jgi:hypothetical protein
MLLEEMRLRCADHLDVPRFLTLTEDGNVDNTTTEVHA